VSAGERDPKILWHEPTKKWVMVISAATGVARFFNSADLKKWEMTCDVPRPGFEECPDLFELPVLDAAGKPTDQTKWVLHDGSFTYSIGTFDGKTFKIEETPGRGDLGQNFYAAQTFNDVPSGRRIQIGWMRGGSFADKGMPFNQQMGFPCELQLRRTDEGIRLYRWPVKEIEKLHVKTHTIKNVKVAAGDNPLKDIDAELIDLQAEIAMGFAKKIAFNLRGSSVLFDGHTVSAGGSNVSMKLKDGVATFRILIDRASIEVFGDEGRLSMTSHVLHDPGVMDLSFTVEGGEALIHKLTVNELKSCWK
jgi:sucrose-6-phosphate hydrolase SacC (GH32 family)